MAIPEVMNLLREMEDLHAKKNADYAGNQGDFYNFDFAEFISREFHIQSDRVFVTLIGIKLGRLAVLLNSGKNPNNESVADSFRDLAMYCVLWAAKRKRFSGSEYQQSQTPALNTKSKQQRRSRK